MTNKAKESAKEFLTALGLVTLAVVSVAVDAGTNNEYGKTTYSDAVDEIMDSDLWRSDMAEIIKALPENESSEFYKGIIAVAKSEDMWRSDKASVIMTMIRKHS